MDTNEETNKPPSTTAKGEERKVTFTRKQLLIAAAVVIVLFGALLIWKSIQVRSLKRERAEKEAALIQEFATIYAKQSAEFLKRLAKPYVWALRTEMLQGNNNQVNLYNNDMVKEKGMISVMVADTKGIVISSTDKKFEGKNFSSLQQGDYLSADSTIVNKVADSLLVMASPIMSFNSKLGTLVVKYAVKTPAVLKQ
jgi:hypothetical protein